MDFHGPNRWFIFVREVLGIPVVNKEVLSQRTNDYQSGVEAYAATIGSPLNGPEKAFAKKIMWVPALRRMEKAKAFGVYFIFKSMEQGRTFRISVPKYPTQDPNHRILAHQTSRFTPYYFYVRDEVLGPNRPNSKLEAAYHKADNAIENIVNLLEAA